MNENSNLQRRNLLKKSLALGGGTALLASLSSNASSFNGGANNFICIESMEELSNILTIEPGSVALVLGFHSKNDGGGGLFFYDNSSASTFNNQQYDGMLVIPSDQRMTGRWIRCWDGGVLNIRWFGAKPNDKDFDCSIAFNTALYYAQQGERANISVSNAGKTILFPSGGYYFNNPINEITKGVVITGEGSTGSTEQIGTTLFVNYSNSDDLHGFIRFNAYQALNTGGAISNLSIKVSSQAFNSNIVTVFSNTSAYVSHWAIQNVRLECNSFAKRALFLRDFVGDGNWRIRDINILNCYFSGATNEFSTVVMSNLANAFVEGCFIYPAGSSAKAGLWVTGENSCTNVHFTGGSLANLKIVALKNSIINSYYENLISEGGSMENVKKVMLELI